MQGFGIMRARACVLVTLAVGTSVATGCHAWHAQPSIADALAVQPDRIQVRLAWGEKLVLEAPRIVEDSLIGFRWEEGVGGRRLALPLHSVESVAFRQFDALRTVAFVAGCCGAALLNSLIVGG